MNILETLKNPLPEIAEEDSGDRFKKYTEIRIMAACSIELSDAQRTRLRDDSGWYADELIAREAAAAEAGDTLRLFVAYYKTSRTGQRVMAWCQWFSEDGTKYDSSNANHVRIEIPYECESTLHVQSQQADAELAKNRAIEIQELRKMWLTQLATNPTFAGTTDPAAVMTKLSIRGGLPVLKSLLDQLLRIDSRAWKKVSYHSYVSTHSVYRAPEKVSEHFDLLIRLDSAVQTAIAGDPVRAHIAAVNSRPPKIERPDYLGDEV